MPRLKSVRIIVVFMVLRCITSCSFAQEANKVDSLVSRLNNMKEDTSYLSVLDTVCREYIIKNNDLETGMKYSKKAFNLADKLIIENQSPKITILINRCKVCTANIIMNIGLYYHIHANYGEAIKNYLEALKIYEEI